METNQSRDGVLSFRKRLLVVFGLYLVNVVLFALAYWLAWSISPDFFIVGSEVNRLPIEALRSIALDDQPPLLDYVADSNLESMSQDQIREFRDLKTTISELTAEREAAILRQRQAYDTLDERLELNFQSYRDQALARFDVEEASIRTELEYVEALLREATDPATVRDLTVKRTELQVQKAELDLDRAERDQEVLQDYFDKREQFIEPEHRAALDAAVKELDSVENELLSAQKGYYELRGTIWETWTEMYSNRIQQLGLTDFLYFSLSVSTANTFGDILPNHSSVRFLVIGQLMLNIILIGVGLTILADQIVRPSR